MNNTKTNFMEKLSRRILNRLKADPRINSFSFKSEIKNNKIIIKGSVPSFLIKKMVGENIDPISEDYEVDNQLTVVPKNMEPDNASIIERAEISLKWNSLLKSDNINVEFKKGFIILEGKTKSLWEKNKAEQIVSEIEGVLGVENRIMVVPFNRIEDEVILKSIQESIAWNTNNIPLEDLDFIIKEGKVTVTGEVPTWPSYNSIYESVLLAEGVREVDMQVQIKARF